jgi:hypothetical protein
MTRITLDEPLKSKLNGLNEQVEICDDDGNVVGCFLPRKVYERMIYDRANAMISDEELERRRQEPGGRTLKEFFDDLEK